MFTKNRKQQFLHAQIHIRNLNYDKQEGSKKDANYRGMTNIFYAGESCPSRLFRYAKKTVGLFKYSKESYGGEKIQFILISL
jgi:hypothetical protein